MTEQDIIIRLKDDSGKEYILYPATKAENIIGDFDKSKVGLDNVPNVATNDQTPTFTEASTRVNIAVSYTHLMYLLRCQREIEYLHHQKQRIFYQDVAFLIMRQDLIMMS